MDKDAANRIPSNEEINAASALMVFDNKGNKVSFGSLYAESRTLVVFIRHFMCGMCHNYVVQLSEIPKAAFEESKTQLVIIGCGEWKLIDNYKKNTGFEGHVYADPTRSLYRHFEMVESLSKPDGDEPKPSYVQGAVSVTLRSMGRMLMYPGSWGRQGNVSQNGGEYVLGPGNKCSMAHRMRHSTDHMDIEDLVNVLKVGEGNHIA